MKFSESFLKIYWISCCILARGAKSQDSFAAVTGYPEIGQLYMKISEKEPHLDPDRSLDAEAKKHLCRSITRSSYFHKNGKDPIDNLDTIYKEVKSLAEKDEMRGYYFKKVLEDYDEVEENTRSTRGTVDYIYKSKSINFSSGSTRRKEFAFVCLTRRRKSDFIDIFFISDPYNMNAASEVSTDLQIKARFICHVYDGSCHVWAIAEEPAVAYASPHHYFVESIYLQMRKFYDVAETESDDPLCGLTIYEKLRVCASVLHSSHFVKKVEYHPDLTIFEENCILRKVSFRNDRLREETKERSYKERMLRCIAEPLADDASFTYYVSRAYYSNHAVVYFRHYETKEWYVENISANISVIVEKNLTPKDECKDSSPPNLVAELENLKKNLTVTMSLQGQGAPNVD